MTSTRSLGERYSREMRMVLSLPCVNECTTVVYASSETLRLLVFLANTTGQSNTSPATAAMPMPLASIVTSLFTPQPLNSRFHSSAIARNSFGSI